MIFVQNSQMTLEAPGKIASGKKIQYLSTIVRGKALRQIDMLSAEVESITSYNLNTLFWI